LSPSGVLAIFDRRREIRSEDSQVTLLPGWLLTIAVFSAFGRVIDFLIGRVGQERAKGFLETWWIKFDDVRWNNFGRKEALFAVTLLDRWFGRRFVSPRRWLSILILFVLLIVSGQLLAICQSQKGLRLPLVIVPTEFAIAPLSAIGLAVSLSLTRLIAVIVARLCDDGSRRNLIIFTIFLIITYFLLALWLPVMQILSIVLTSLLISTKPSSISEVMSLAQAFIDRIMLHSGFYLVSPNSIVEEFRLATNQVSIFPLPPIVRERLFELYAMRFADVCAGYTAYIVRLMIAIVFVGSFIVRPILMNPISLNPDVAPIHDRQMVVLDRADWMAWLDLTSPESELLRPLPAASLAVEQVR
jgi:hypothetical protein